MNASFRAGLLAGTLAGALLASLGWAVYLFRKVPAPPLPAPVQAAAPTPPAPKMEWAAAPPPAVEPPPPAPPPAPPPPPDLKARFDALAGKGLAAFQSPDFRKAAEELKAAGRPGLDLLAERLRTSTTAGERFLAAALLEQLGDAAAVPALAEVLQSDVDAIVRRMASHAIAVLGSPDGEAALRAASTGDADWGVRVNSAYGLAKLGKDDGLRQLQQSYESPDTPPEYRIPVLGGLADVAAPSTAPLFRRILEDSKDMSYLLISINALGKMKDAEAIPALRRLAASEQPEMVKQAAAKAVDLIQAPR